MTLRPHGSNAAFVAIACVVEVREQLKGTSSRSLSPGQVTTENLTKTCEHLLESITDLKSILPFDRYILASGLFDESEEEMGEALDGWSFRFEKHSAFVQMCFIVLGLSDERVIVHSKLETTS